MVVQMNGHVSRSEQLLQGGDEDRSQGRSRIESKLNNVSPSIDPEKALDRDTRILGHRENRYSRL
jgi:hypothetical protein